MIKEPRSIVILHGWESSPQRWESVGGRLSSYARTSKPEKFKLYVPHLPGFGEKASINSPFTIEDYVDWFKGYLEEKKIHKPLLVAHSNGARIAIKYASQNKHAVSALVLIGAAGVLDNNSLKKDLFRLVAKTGKVVLLPFKRVRLYSIAQKALYKVARESDYLKASPYMKKTMQNMLAYDALADVTDIHCPTLIIWGREDRETPIWMGKRLATHIKKSTLKIIDGGHNVHKTHPEKIARLIYRFALRSL